MQLVHFQEHGRQRKGPPSACAKKIHARARNIDARGNDNNDDDKVTAHKIKASRESSSEDKFDAKARLINVEGDDKEAADWSSLSCYNQKQTLRSLLEGEIGYVQDQTLHLTQE